MKKIILCSPLVLVSFFSANYEYLKPKYLIPNHEQYQDIIINGVVVSHGSRECATRYEAIKEVLKNYTRPFTVLDIGASQGYFSFRIAHDFPKSVCVMIEGNYSDEWQIAEQLHDLCKLNNELDNIIFLKKRITADDLERLAEVEHFDVILACNIIHHTAHEWRRFTDALFKLGDHLILETPPAQETTIPLARPIDEYLATKHGTIICSVARHTNPHLKGKMYLFDLIKDRLHKAYIAYQAKITHDDKWKIESSYEAKELVKKVDKNVTKKTDWIPGINLMTFKMFNGVHPACTTIRELLTSLDYNHPDPFLWNMILDGKNLHFIDCNKEEINKKFDPAKCLEYNVQLFNLANQQVDLFIRKQEHVIQCQVKPKKTPYPKTPRYVKTTSYFKRNHMPEV
jgi:2-polyprenyl-3-methyl-5-hydroxy-6-metoxy-1,4-benzoquinol methylase